MGKDKQETGMGLAEIGVNLDELIQRGARQVIQQAIEAELAQLLEQYANVKPLTGQQTVVRNGYLPEREVLTGVGPVTVKVPKVRDRSGGGVKFNSTRARRYRCYWGKKRRACRRTWSAGSRRNGLRNGNSGTGAT